MRCTGRHDAGHRAMNDMHEIDALKAIAFVILFIVLVRNQHQDK